MQINDLYVKVDYIMVGCVWLQQPCGYNSVLLFERTVFDQHPKIIIASVPWQEMLALPNVFMT